jgi:hypothetical protein
VTPNIEMDEFQPASVVVNQKETDTIVVKLKRKNAEYLKSFGKSYDDGVDMSRQKIDTLEQANEANGVLAQQKLDRIIKSMEKMDKLIDYIEKHTG